MRGFFWLFTYCLFSHLPADTQAIQCAGKITLSNLILRHTVLLAQLLLCLLTGAEGTVHINIFRSFRCVQQQQHPFLVNLEHALCHSSTVGHPILSLEP